MRVLVTGAAGFVGSHVVRHLAAAGHDVVALSRAGRRPGFDAPAEWVTADLTDPAARAAAVTAARPDACVHLAWYAEPGKYLTAEAENLACMAASLDLLRDLVRVGCRRLVMAGTCAEYDADPGYLREDGPTKPATVYAACKLATGLVGRQIAAAAGASFAWARLFYLYGPGEDPRRMVPALMTALARGEPFPATPGDQVRDYLHVTDVASALRVLAEAGADGVYNVSSGRPITVRDLMETAGRVAGRADLIRFGAVPYRGTWDPPFICGDNRRLRNLGWQPWVGLEEGLAGLRADAIRG